MSEKGSISRIFNWIQVGIHTGIVEMRSHVLRSILSSLGVLFGVFVMVAMLSLMGGLDNYLKNNMSQWIGTVFIHELDDIPKEKLVEFSRSPGLRFSDGIYLENKVTDAVDKVYKSIRRREEVEVAGETHRISVTGLDSNTLQREFTIGTKMAIKQGRSFSPDEYLKGGLVCLISQDAASKLKREMRRMGKDTAALIGTSLNLYNRRFQIVGIYGPEDPGARRRHMHENIYMPLLTMKKYVTGFNPDPGAIILNVRDPMKMESQMARIVSALVAKHRGVEDFEYHKADFLQEFIAMMNNVSRIMGIIALISLSAGGLGIMNVMLSSISERIREIGVRKALGAGNLQIFVQFIAETSTLCFFGGAAGALLGCIPMAFGEAIRQGTDGIIKPMLLPQYLFLVLFIIIFMGIIFGLYPAVKASRMNPIDALRYE